MPRIPVNEEIKRHFRGRDEAHKLVEEDLIETKLGVCLDNGKQFVTAGSALAEKLKTFLREYHLHPSPFTLHHSLLSD